MDEMTKVFVGWSSLTALLIAVVVLLATGLSGTTQAQSPVGPILVTTVIIPGWGGYRPSQSTFFHPAMPGNRRQ